jgi:hypothetical protein
MIIDFTPPSRPTLAYKMLVLLQDFPDIRNSYDLICEKWNLVYGATPQRETIERVARTIQYDLNIYPPSEETKRARRSAQKHIIAHAHEKSLIKKIISWFK